MLEFKRETLAQAGLDPIAERHEVPVDLRENWPKALCDSGFEPALPTAWLVEGLLIYLSSAAQDQLFDAIVLLSTPGSRVAIEQMDPLPAAAVAEMAEHDDAGSDWVRLIYNDPRSEATEWFTDRGWTGERIYLNDYIRHLGHIPAAQQSLINLVTVVRP